MKLGLQRRYSRVSSWVDLPHRKTLPIFYVPGMKTWELSILKSKNDWPYKLFFIKICSIVDIMILTTYCRSKHYFKGFYSKEYDMLFNFVPGYICLTINSSQNIGKWLAYIINILFSLFSMLIKSVFGVNNHSPMKCIPSWHETQFKNLLRQLIKYHTSQLYYNLYTDQPY